MPNNIYVYKEYCDENAYDEEIIELYSTKENAKKRLKERVENAFELPFEEIPKELELSEADTFNTDYVSIDNGDGAVSYWVIEEAPLNESSSSKRPETWILTNISEVVDGMTYAGMPTVYSSEEAAIESAKRQLADDFGISVEDVENEAWEDGTPYVLSMNRDGRPEASTVAQAEAASHKDTVPRGTFEQVQWERDVAISQLKELGYRLGEKIKTIDKTEDKQRIINREAAIKEIEKMLDYDGFRDGDAVSRRAVIMLLRNMAPESQLVEY